MGAQERMSHLRGDETPSFLVPKISQQQLINSRQLNKNDAYRHSIHDSRHYIHNVEL